MNFKKILIIFTLIFSLFTITSTIKADDIPFVSSEYKVEKTIDNISFVIHGLKTSDNKIKVYIYGTALEDLENIKFSARIEKGIGVGSLQEKTALYSNGVTISAGDNFLNSSGVWANIDKIEKGSNFTVILLTEESSLSNQIANVELSVNSKYSTEDLNNKLEKDKNGEKINLSKSDIFGSNVTPFSLGLKIDVDNVDYPNANVNTAKTQYNIKKGSTKVISKNNSNIFPIILIISIIVLIATIIGAYIYVYK